MDRPCDAAPPRRGEPRTRLEDIEAAGYELSEDHLRLVSGARPPSTSAPICTSPGGDCGDVPDALMAP